MLCIPIILTVVFAKKLYDFIFPFELEKVYLTLGLYAVKTYTYSYLIYKKIMDFFTINNNNILIIPFKKLRPRFLTGSIYMYSSKK